MLTLGRAGQAAFAVVTAQLIGVLSVAGLVPPNSDRLDFLAVGLVIVFGLVLLVPTMVLALVVWRLQRARFAMLAVVVLLLALHVIGVGVVVGWWHTVALDEDGFLVPGPPAITVGYQVLMTCALAAVAVLLITARRRHVEQQSVLWLPPSPPAPTDDRPGPHQGGYQAKHLGGVSRFRLRGEESV
jgi:hypothetical protein